LTYVVDSAVPDSTCVVGKIYPVGFAPIPADSINIRLEPLHVELHEGPLRKFKAHTINLKHPEVPSAQGRKYVIIANIIESAIQVVENGVQWARSNLWYDVAAPVGYKYRFRASPHYMRYDGCKFR